MSASSWCVTCGIITQLRARFGPLIFWIRVSGWRSTSPKRSKSTFGHGARSRPATSAPAAPRGRRAPRRCGLTSSLVIRPLRPVPRIVAQVDAELARQAAHGGRGVRRAPSPVPACGEAGLRRRRRGAGASCSSSWIAASTSLDAAGASVLGDGARGRRLGAVAVGSDLEREDRRALGDLVADARPRSPRPCRRSAPGPPSSPCRTRASTSGSSAATSSPDGDEHLDHGHVGEVPDVRDQDLFGASHRRLPQTRHGAGRSVSMP